MYIEVDSMMKNSELLHDFKTQTWQEVQLSQRDCMMLCVIQYFAKLLKGVLRRKKIIGHNYNYIEKL